MPVMTAGDIGAKRISIEQEIRRLEQEVVYKKSELIELQNNCPHPSLTKVRVFRNNVDFCNNCGFEKRYKDMDDRDDRAFRALNS